MLSVSRKWKNSRQLMQRNLKNEQCLHIHRLSSSLRQFNIFFCGKAMSNTNYYSKSQKKEYFYMSYNMCGGIFISFLIDVLIQKQPDIIWAYWFIKKYIIGYLKKHGTYAFHYVIYYCWTFTVFCLATSEWLFHARQGEPGNTIQLRLH